MNILQKSWHSQNRHKKGGFKKMQQNTIVKAQNKPKNSFNETLYIHMVNHLNLKPCSQNLKLLRQIEHSNLLAESDKTLMSIKINRLVIPEIKEYVYICTNKIVKPNLDKPLTCDNKTLINAKQARKYPKSRIKTNCRKCGSKTHQKLVGFVKSNFISQTAIKIVWIQ